MTGTPRVIADARAVYVAWGDKGSVYRITPDGQVTEQLREPAPLAPMICENDAAEWAAELLVDIRMSKAARKAIGEALGVEW
jgi:hypothetical protein